MGEATSRSASRRQIPVSKSVSVRSSYGRSKD
jgi:hypothetical protein